MLGQSMKSPASTAEPLYGAGSPESFTGSAPTLD